MNDDEFDIEKFIDLFDTAMTSDNPTVRRAFKNLLIVAALVDSEAPPRSVGPMRGLYNQIDELRRRISQIETKKYQPNYPNTVGTYPSTNTPTWTVSNIPPITYTIDTSGTVPYATTSVITKLDSIYTGLNKDANE